MSAEGGVRITEVRVVDPFALRDEVTDVWIDAGGRFAEPSAGGAATTIAGRGLWLVPRVTDLHVHFREPGQEQKEDIGSGSRAAAAGGVSVVGLMPNTVPVVDDGARMAHVLSRVADEQLVTAWGIGAVTRSSAGAEPADWDGLRQAGARALSDDGHPVASSRLMAQALDLSARYRLPIIQHLEDPELAAGGVAHAGAEARRWGLPGMPAAAESVLAWRDVALVRAYGGHLHFAHCSVPGTLEALAWAQDHALTVTGEAAPHHLLLTDEALSEWHGQAVAKVNPPLRPAAMRDALQAAVVAGRVSVVASDHAPHTEEEKRQPFQDAPFGISGVETLLAVVLTVFCQTGRLSPLAAMALVTTGPHRVVGEPYPGVVPGAVADAALIDPTRRWRVDPTAFYSRGHNTPLAGHWLTGKVVGTLHNGRWTYREGRVEA